MLTPVYPRQNVGRQGADIVVGQTVIARGDVLNPSRIGALAALGVGDVEVFAKPTVAILSTGNEIADPGQELQPGQIYDINKFTLSTIIAGARRRADAVRHRARHHRGARGARSMRARRATCWCSRAAARSASAI